MITTTAVAGVALLELGMAMTPGPNMVYLASRALTQGRRAGLVSLAGTGVGFVCYLVATAAGLSALFAAVPVAYTVVKLAGAVYLGYLAWGMIKPGSRSPLDPAQDLTPDSDVRLFSMGMVTNLLNPKIALLYAALLPQFLDPHAGPAWTQLLQLGAVQIIVGLAVNAVVVLGAARASRFLAARPRGMAAVRYTAGGVLGAFALRTALSRTPASA
ncbi:MULTISPECIES: LysE family translocator [Prauserella salsuginis group]|uniref:Threonine/homoserine/homoserine lactone efflux protein n=2 Tax=Prauserella salsuginis group TaxID=2893672 RepID=A0A839XMX5_9PSEU|nr:MULTISPECIES: LysE family translocator [Prauserella salsuginis group]MBB3663977.1 threonine/homoserine/homoserine lactone efflux protein [Prauserella sediminis]MCR3721433.1 Threonine/homoserine/homoserine lactone efflux protein [Prauserella flava]MCR3732423.1 Threonine/homoserine/homoserine lactone efflux protein [Prauserella salsuginis]